MPDLFSALRFKAGVPFSLALHSVPGVTVQVCAPTPEDIRNAEDAAGPRPALGSLLLQQINEAHLKDVRAAVAEIEAAPEADRLSAAAKFAELATGRARRLWALRQDRPEDAAAIDARIIWQMRRAYEITARGLRAVPEWEGFAEAAGDVERVKVYLNAFEATDEGSQLRSAFLFEVASAIDGEISRLGKASSAPQSGRRTGTKTGDGIASGVHPSYASPAAAVAPT